jgi:hypothetical protein
MARRALAIVLTSNADHPFGGFAAQATLAVPLEFENAQFVD